MEHTHLEIGSKIEVKVRCPGCRRTLLWVSKEGVGIIERVCPHTDCKRKTSFLLFSGRPYVIDKKLLKREHILASLTPEYRECITNIVIK